MEKPVYHLEELYDGPLDLLLALIAKNKMNILDIKISLIFDQYMEYVAAMRESDMEIAGEFIVMASELMYIKSRMLLPHEKEDPRAALAQALMEYKQAKEAAAWLSEREKQYAGRFCKDTDEIEKSSGKLEDMSPDVLRDALKRMLLRMADYETEKRKNRSENIEPIIKKQIIPVSTKIVSVMRVMYRRKTVHFDDLFENVRSRSEIIAVFYAILELLRADRISMSRQSADGDYSDIILNFNYSRRNGADE